MNLNSIPLITANSKNYNTSPRNPANVKYIVIHYTGNTGDTAKNNVDYFKHTVTYTSAHFFVSEDTVYQSVPINHTAYSVGLGNRKEPYIKYPIMWKKITNSNSISIELCGSKTSTEASDKTKKTAASLVCALMRKLNLTPSCIYRHFDVTGKQCPAWAVSSQIKWLEFKEMVCSEFYATEDNEMLNTEENYSVFKQFMDRYVKEVSSQTTTDTWKVKAMAEAKEAGLMDGTRPDSNVTRAELAVVATRIKNLVSEIGKY